MSVGGPNSGVSHSVVLSLDFYCSFIDPASPDYGVDEQATDREKNKTRAGMQISTGKRAPMENVLVEDCRFRFCGLNTQNFGGVMRNVVFRRNLVLDRYPVHGHTMGMWGAYATILVEECIFDHNGWLLQNVPENKGKRGLAIMLSKHDRKLIGIRRNFGYYSYLKLGTEYSLNGNTRKGLRAYLRAIQICPFAITPYPRLAVCLLGSRVFRKMLQIKTGKPIPKWLQSG